MAAETRKRRLLIVSNMAHYMTPEGLVGWGPTVEEIRHLATLFDEVVHIGCLHREPAPRSSLPYGCKNLRFVPMRPAGGQSLLAKAHILERFPVYARAIFRELPAADVVHVRAPANISLLAMVLLAFISSPHKRWIKYAGNWRPEGPEPFSYRFQRWWLRRNFARAKVTVNGNWPAEPPHIVSFPNPCLTREEWQRAGGAAKAKVLFPPLQFVFAGALTLNKGVEVAITMLDRLRHRGIEARLLVAGDGRERAALERLSQKIALGREVAFLGFVPHAALAEHYKRAHFVLLPSRSEGWPKVLSEGMAYGAVPIASAVSCIPQALAEAGCGVAVRSFNPEDYANAILGYLHEPERWKREVIAGHAYAERFTYEAHVRRVCALLAL